MKNTLTITDETGTILLTTQIDAIPANEAALLILAALKTYKAPRVRRRDAGKPRERKPKAQATPPPAHPTLPGA